MKKISLFQTLTEEYSLDVNAAELKKITSEDREKKFFIWWFSKDKFMISLNFSVGTYKALDINYKSKSGIRAYGTVSNSTHSGTHVKIETRPNYGLFTILIIPVILLILQLSYNLNLPIFFYIVPLAFFVFASAVFKSEERRLLQYFQEYIHNRNLTDHGKTNLKRL